MAKYRPIVYDYIENGRPSLEDRMRARLAELPRKARQRPTASNPIGNALAGDKARGKVSIRGGKFEPGPTSGML